jgi:hypothetical protein
MKTTLITLLGALTSKRLGAKQCSHSLSRCPPPYCNNPCGCVSGNIFRKPRTVDGPDILTVTIRNTHMKHLAVSQTLATFPKTLRCVERVKLSKSLRRICLTKHHAMKMYWEKARVATRSALDEAEWPASRPGRFTPKKRASGTHWTWG